jgi:hypothetical protein
MAAAITPPAMAVIIQGAAALRIRTVNTRTTKPATNTVRTNNHRVNAKPIVLMAARCIALSTVAQLDFMDYPCTQDCSGHEAGYRWAEHKGIEDSDDRRGNSNSFIQGCKAYVAENYPASAASDEQ